MMMLLGWIPLNQGQRLTLMAVILLFAVQPTWVCLRRWVARYHGQFSLRTLLLLVTGFACMAALLRDDIAMLGRMHLDDFRWGSPLWRLDNIPNLWPFADLLAFSGLIVCVALWRRLNRSRRPMQGEEAPRSAGPSAETEPLSAPAPEPRTTIDN